MKICYKRLITSYRVNRDRFEALSGHIRVILVTRDMVDRLKRIFTFLLQGTNRRNCVVSSYFILIMAGSRCADLFANLHNDSRIPNVYVDKTGKRWNLLNLINVES
jgi:hypothetical protein